MTESNESFASSRFLLWDRPLAYPKFDLITRDTNPGRVFDLNVDLDSYDGSVYLKVEHIVEMARTVGMLTAEEVQKLKAENAELKRQINRLPVVQEELKRGLDDLTAKFFARLNSVDSITDPIVFEDEPNDEQSVKAESGTVPPFSF